MMSNKQTNRIAGPERSGLVELDPLADQTIGLEDAVRHFERYFILEALELTAGNQKKAAELLGVKHTTLHAKIRRLGIIPAGKRALPDCTMKDLAGTESGK
ncbi:MAG: hypothetical protein KF762_08715 [Acidobacteria bacterium]|nr:hypothetical protein [Acidobacteriota bacterium]